MGAEYAIFSVNLFARAKYRPRRKNREKENIGREESPGLVISRIFDSQQPRRRPPPLPIYIREILSFPSRVHIFLSPSNPSSVLPSLSPYLLFCL